MYIISFFSFAHTTPNHTIPYHCMQVSEEQSLEREEKLQHYKRTIRGRLSVHL